MQLLDRWEEEVYASSGISILKLMVTIFGTCHWVACLWYSVGQSDDVDPMSPDGSQHVLGWGKRKYTDAASDASITDRYLATYYWALMNIMTVDVSDGGDITPRTTNERLTSMFTMLLGGAVFALIVGSECRISIR